MPNFIANLTMLYSELPVVERFAAAASGGFQIVEFQFPDREPSFDEFASAAEDAGCRVVQFNMTVGAGSDGGPWLASDPSATETFRTALELAAVQAGRLGAEFVTVHAGRSIPGVDRERQLDTLRFNIDLAATTLAESGVVVLFEALNSLDNPDWLIDTQAAGAAFVRGIGNPNLGLQFDAYHAAMAGEELLESYSDAADIVAHIQFADAPGRNQPGTGEVHLQAFFAAVDESGYDGWMSAEYWPDGATSDTLAWFSGP